MKFAALLTLCLVPLFLRAQEFAPVSVGDMAYSARPTFPSLGSTFAAGAILSGKGVFISLNLAVPPSRQSGPYAWTKTGANTGTLVLGTASSAWRHELVFTGNGRGTYRETDMATGAVVTGEFAMGAMPNGPPPPLANLSIRTTLVGGRPATIGFVVEGTTSRRVLVRAVGPTLAQFGVANPAANPVLTVFRGTAQIGVNAGWGGVSHLAAAAAAAGAFALFFNSRDSAIELTLEPGSYTAQARDANGGEVLLEVYFAN